MTQLLLKPKTGCDGQISHNLHDEELRLLMILRFLIIFTMRNLDYSYFENRELVFVLPTAESTTECGTTNSGPSTQQAHTVAARLI